MIAARVLEVVHPEAVDALQRLGSGARRPDGTGDSVALRRQLVSSMFLLPKAKQCV
jgi:hypothetical protein